MCMHARRTKVVRYQTGSATYKRGFYRKMLYVWSSAAFVLREYFLPSTQLRLRCRWETRERRSEYNRTRQRVRNIFFAFPGAKRDHNSLSERRLQRSHEPDRRILSSLSLEWERESQPRRVWSLTWRGQGMHLSRGNNNHEYEKSIRKRQ